MQTRMFHNTKDTIADLCQKGDLSTSLGAVSCMRALHASWNLDPIRDSGLVTVLLIVVLQKSPSSSFDTLYSLPVPASFVCACILCMCLHSSYMPASFICTCILCMYLYHLYAPASSVCTCFLCMYYIICMYLILRLHVPDSSGYALDPFSKRCSYIICPGF